MEAKMLAEAQAAPIAARIAREYGDLNREGRAASDDDIRDCLSRIGVPPRYPILGCAGGGGIIGWRERPERWNHPENLETIICASPYAMQDALYELWRRGNSKGSRSKNGHRFESGYLVNFMHEMKLKYYDAVACELMGALRLLCGNYAHGMLTDAVGRNSSLLWHSVNSGDAVHDSVRAYVHGKHKKYFELPAVDIYGAKLAAVSYAMFREAAALAGHTDGVLKWQLSCDIGAYAELFRLGVWAFVVLPNALVVCKAPVSFRHDDEDRLHSVDGAALEWADGRKQYFVHGVLFEEELWRSAFGERSITAREAVCVGNMEQRSVILEFIGWDTVLEQLDAKVLDEVHVRDAGGGELAYQVLEAETRDDPRFEAADELGASRSARFVRVQCPSTHKSAVLRVDSGDPSTRTCMGAIAWTFGMAEKEYAPAMET